MVSSSIIYAKTFHRGFVNLDAKAVAFGKRHRSAAQRDRLLHEILGEVEIRQADAPVDIRHRAGEMHRRGRADARLGDLGGDVDPEPELAAQPAGRERLTQAAELDQLERDALAVRTRGRLDVAERMDALVKTDRHPPPR